MSLARSEGSCSLCAYGLDGSIRGGAGLLPAWPAPPQLPGPCAPSGAAVPPPAAPIARPRSGIPAGPEAAAFPPPRPPPRGAERRCRPGRAGVRRAPSRRSQLAAARARGSPGWERRDGATAGAGLRWSRRLSRGSREAATLPHPTSLRRRNFSSPRPADPRAGIFPWRDKLPRSSAPRLAGAESLSFSPPASTYPPPAAAVCPAGGKEFRTRPAALPARRPFPLLRCLLRERSSRRSPLLCLSPRLHHPPYIAERERWYLLWRRVPG